MLTLPRLQSTIALRRQTPVFQGNTVKISDVDTYTKQQVVALTHAANKVTAQILEDFIGKLRAGMTEQAARILLKQTLESYKAQGLVKNWHAPVVNFGVNTVRSIEASGNGPDQTLRESDIVYVDIGPVVNINGKDIEGDLGGTFVFGNDPEFRRLQATSKAIFDKGVAYWKKRRPTGIELYQYLHRISRQAGYEFNLKEAGHLIGEFSHSYAWKDGLNKYPHAPEPGMWVLEIQIKHPTLPYGAFYENILE